MKNKPSPNHFTVFEHQSLIEGKMYDGNEFTIEHHQRLRDFYKEKDFPFYALTGHGVRFCQYVGVLQIGILTVEILPKVDKLGDATTWKKRLIEMLKTVGLFKIHAPSSSALTLQSNSILDLYLDLYLTEIEYLLHRGLVKRYRKTEGNTTALKGNLQFSKHIQQNLVHQERFYVNYTTYDAQHSIHSILYKALRLVKQINTKNALHSRIGALLLNFPEMPDVKISEATFDRITYNRKDEHYQTALEIARLLLLNYHPDVSKGRNHVLALLFDMNLLWEQFVYISLKKQLKERAGYSIKQQVPKAFWRQENNEQTSGMKPDIVIETDKKERIVLDTKWKNLNGGNPSLDDLRQMYAYHTYFEAQKVALIYPTDGNTERKGGFYVDKQTGEKATDTECSIISIATISDMNQWQMHIFDTIYKWIHPSQNAS